MTFQDMIDQGVQLRTQKSALDAQVKALENQIKELDQQLMDHMRSEGVTHSANGRAALALIPKKYPNVKDWDAFWESVYENRLGYLLHRRVSQSKVEELLNAGEVLPGVEIYEGEVLNFKVLQ